MHEFQKIEQENLNTPIFTNITGGSNTIFYVCHKDNTKPILERYSSEEKKARRERCQRLIEFVNRRDLNRQYISIYENKMKEEWKFANSISSNESNSLVESDQEEENPGDHTHISENNAEQLSITGTLPLNQEDDKMQIDTETRFNDQNG